MEENRLTISGDEPKATDQKPSWWEQYGVWDYYKEHTAFGITCISAAIAILSLSISVIAVTKDIVYLRYWNVDSVYASLRSNSPIYCVFCSFLMIVTGFLITDFSAWYYSVSKSYFSYLSVCHCIVDYDEKYAKSLSRKLLEKKRLYKKNGIPIDEEEFDRIEKEINDAIRSSKSVKKYSRGIYWEFFAKIFFRIIIVSLVYLLATAFMHLYSTGIGIKTIISWLTFILMILIALIVQLCRVKKQIKKENESIVWSIEEREEIRKRYFEKTKKPLSIPQFSISKIRNDTFAVTLLLFFCCIILVAIVEIFYGWSNAVYQKDFDICKHENSAYAIIYRSENKCIMEQVYIRDGNIIVDTARQRVTGFGDLEYERMRFDKVEKLPSKGESLNFGSLESEEQHHI